MYRNGTQNTYTNNLWISSATKACAHEGSPDVKLQLIISARQMQRGLQEGWEESAGRVQGLARGVQRGVPGVARGVQGVAPARDVARGMQEG